MPIDASQVQWDQAPKLDPSQIQWDEAQTQSPSIGRQFLESAKQAGSGIMEGAIGLVNLPMEAVRAGGEVLGVDRKYLPLSTAEINQRNIESGVTADEPSDFGGKSVRFTGNVLGGAAATPAKSVNVVQEAMRKALPKIKPGADAVRQELLERAGTAGYSVPRSNIKQTTLTNLGERFGGKQAIEATAQQSNQPITNKLAARAVGLRDDVPLTIDALKEVRKEAGKAYEVVANLGTLSSDKAYKKALGEIRAKFSGASKDFPELANQEVGKLARSMNKPSISAEGAVEQIKNLREAASANLSRTSTAKERLLGKAQREAANALEDLVERNIEPKLGKEILGNYRSSRKLIAKTHTIQQALTPNGNVDATVIARLSKKLPLDGDLKTIADFAAGFKRLAREPQGAPPSGGLFEPLIYGSIGGVATGGPGAVAALVPIVGKPLARKFMTTVPKSGVSSKGLGNTDNPIAQRVSLGAGLTVYQQQTTDIRERINQVKQSELTNRQKRKQIDSLKLEMGEVFKDARQNLNRDEFRQLRTSVK